MKKWYFFGQIREDHSITKELMQEIMAEAKQHKEAVRELPLAYILNVLDAVGDFFADPCSEFYKMTEKLMPAQLGWSVEMIREGLATIADILDLNHLQQRLSADIDQIDYLDKFRYNPAFKGLVKAVPLGVVSHVSAGNVFVGAVDSLVSGILTKNVNILKMSSADPIFPLIFAQALQRADYKGILSKSFALVPFKGGDKEVEAILKETSDGLIVYGGDEAIKAYREGAGFHTRIIEYGPKYSLVILDSSAINDENRTEVAHAIARDFTMWEQSACSSPHAVFIDSFEEAERFALSLADGLNEWSYQIPHSRIPLNEAVEIVRTRELARVEKALGEAELLLPKDYSQDWTVILEKKCDFKVSCHHRTAYIIVSANHDEETLNALASYGEYIQSVSILAPLGRFMLLSDKLTAMGADRITEIGNMTRRKHGTPHDGTRASSELVRWVSAGIDRPFASSFEYLEDEKREQITLDKLNAFLRYVRKKSPFYADRLPDHPLKKISELSAIPILSPDELKRNLPPKGKGLLTDSLGYSISFGSGGTTGDPKFIHRTLDKNHLNAELIGKGYELSIFDKEDVVANMLFAGNMWASFLSHNEGLEKTGCHILPLAGNIPMTDIVSVLKAFKANGLISIPSVVLSLAEYIDKNQIEGVQIEKIVTGGEHLFPEAKAYIANVLGTKKFASTGYLSNDTGCIGYQCEDCDGPVHHIHEDYCIMEVVHPETNEPVPDGDVGKILVTNFTHFLMPLIRYDIGDMGRILTYKCSCGRQISLMELLGRSDDTLIIGGGNIQLDSIAKVIRQFPEMSFHFRMTAAIEDKKDKLLIEIESLKPLEKAYAKELEQAIYERLLIEKHEFHTFLSGNIIIKPEIKIVDPDVLPRNTRTGKLKQVIDLRHG